MSSTAIKSRVDKTALVKCETCGTGFEAYVKENRKFCSKFCWKNSKKGVAFIEHNGNTVNCFQCSKPVYKSKSRIQRSKTHFCSTDCQIAYQGRNKISFECKTCGSEFKKSKSDVSKSKKRGYQILYCSIECRNGDAKMMSKKSHHANKKRVEKYGLNSFELAGRDWLLSLGFVNDVDFKEQQLLFSKVSVDAYFPKQKIVVQFDGNYWHTKPERKQIDKEQDAFLVNNGITVLRILDLEVKQFGFDKFNNELKSIIYGE